VQLHHIGAGPPRVTHYLSADPATAAENLPSSEASALV
jgi:hypothetical protein